MSFLIIRARKLIPFGDKVEPIKDVLISTDKITSGDPANQRIFMRSIGEYELEKADWDKLMESLGV